MYHLWKRGIISHSKKVVSQAFKRTASTASVKEGDVIHNYEVTRVSSVPQLFLDAIELKHLKTNSKHLHLARDDSNNVFNVLLRTTPMDSTGVAHILEHIVLCGSKKYPVRDPFFKMLDRSMATFMNAMTGSDYTMYPFATQNSADFKNLLSIYLDAVFFPQINESSFLQEGWRLENSDCNDQNSQLILKGVVFNEMKGVMADQDYLFGTNMQSKLLPDHTYGNSSGGDPLAIPDLTYDALKKFHATHYHPSNAGFFTYGNMDLVDHLKQIDEEVMQKFDPISPDTDVPAQPRWSSPRSAEITCCPDEMAADPEKQTSVALSYLLSDVSDSYESFVLSFLCSLLSDGPSSPFYKALIDSGIGSSYAPATGFHSHQKECIFSIGLQGIHNSDTEKIKGIILRTLDLVVKDGFSDERVSGLLHQVELNQKHQKSQFGLHLSFNLMPLWQHGSDPMDLLDIDKHIARLRKDLDKDPKLFQKYCRKYFVDNSHNLTLIMTPDPNHNSERDAKESTLLQSKISQLNDRDIEQLFQRGQDLAMLQNKKEDLSCLPTLLVSDIPREFQASKVDLYSFGDVKVGMHNQPTNGITYLTLMRTINDLPETLKPFLPLFCSVLTQIGTLDRDYRQFSEVEELYTGGLQASVHVSPSPDEKNMLESSIVFQSHCLDKNSEKMFELWTEVIKRPFFGNKERFQTLVRQNAQGLANSVPFSGHLFAMASASSGLSPSAQLTEMWEGLGQVRTMQAIANEENMEHILAKMQEIANYVLANVMQPTESARCAIHCTPDVRNKTESVLSGFLSEVMGIHARQLQPLVQNVDILRYADRSSFQATRPKRTLQVLPLPVNFASMCLPTATTYSHPDSPALQILSRILTTKFLLREVREKGGAYGAGARHGSDGVFQFFSYRDPRSTDTIDSFQQSISWACEGGFSAEELDEAKLATFQKVDAPVAPCNQGNLYFTKGITDDMRQTHRERLLDATRENIINVAVKYLTAENKNCVILGPKNDQSKCSEDWEVHQAGQAA